MKKILFSIIGSISLIVLPSCLKMLTPVDKIESRILLKSEELIYTFDYEPSSNMIYYLAGGGIWYASLYRFDIEKEEVIKINHPEIFFESSIYPYLSLLKNGQVLVLGTDELLFFKNDELIKTVPLWNFNKKPKDEILAENCPEEISKLERILSENENLEPLGYIDLSSLKKIVTNSPRFILGAEIAFDLYSYRKCNLLSSEIVSDIISKSNLSLKNPETTSLNYNEYFPLEDDDFTVFKNDSKNFAITYDYFNRPNVAPCEGYIEEIFWDDLVWRQAACQGIIDSFPVSGHIFINEGEFIHTPHSGAREQLTPSYDKGALSHLIIATKKTSK